MTIPRRSYDPNNPAPDLLGQMADAAEMTAGNLLGRPEVVGKPDTDLLALAQAEILDSNEAKVEPEVFEALMGLDFKNHPDALISLVRKGIVSATYDWLRPTMEKLGDKLTGQEVAKFWNRHIDEFIQKQASGVDKTKLSRQLGYTFSALLANCLTDDDVITLEMPNTEIIQPITSLCFGLTRGSVLVLGDVGFAFAEYAGGTVDIEVQGNADKFTGINMYGDCRIVVCGNVNDGAGVRASGGKLEIWGSAGQMLARDANGDAIIVVHQNSLGGVGFRATGSTKIVIEGNVEGSVGDEVGAKVDIEIKGQALWIAAPANDFLGNISVGGQQIYQDGVELV